MTVGPDRLEVRLDRDRVEVCRLECAVRARSVTSGRPPAGHAPDAASIPKCLFTPEVKVDGDEVTLANKEYELLLMLASDPHRVFTKSELLRDIWGYRTVDLQATKRFQLGDFAVTARANVLNVFDFENYTTFNVLSVGSNGQIDPDIEVNEFGDMLYVPRTLSFEVSFNF